MSEAIRIPGERLTGLPDVAYASRDRTFDGLFSQEDRVAWPPS